MRTPSAIYRISLISIMLGLNFGRVGTNSAMTHVVVLSIKQGEMGA